MISRSTSAKRSVAWCNSPPYKLLCVSQKVACLTCALIYHWRRRWLANQSWLQMPALLDFSISFVVNGTAKLEVDPAPAPSLCPRELSSVGVAGLGWLDGKSAQRAHEEHVTLSMQMNDFDEPEISQTRPSKKPPQASPVAACLRPRCLAQNRRIVSDFRHLEGV